MQIFNAVQSGAYPIAEYDVAWSNSESFTSFFFCVFLLITVHESECEVYLTPHRRFDVNPHAHGTRHPCAPAELAPVRCHTSGGRG